MVIGQVCVDELKPAFLHARPEAVHIAQVPPEGKVLVEVQSFFNFQACLLRTLYERIFNRLRRNGAGKNYAVSLLHEVHRSVQRVFGGSGPFPVAEDMEQVHAIGVLMRSFTVL
jgi:hypothetical protein